MSEDISSVIESLPARRLFDHRILFLSDGVSSRTAKVVIEQLLALDAADPTRDIWLFVNSPGGEVSSGYGIYDTMRFLRAKTKVVVSGMCASIATVIFLGADKEHRYATPNSRFLIHQPLIGGSFQGAASDIEITANEILKTREGLVQLYHRETGQSVDRLRKDIDRDYWMSAEEALQYGLCTRVVRNWNEIR